MKENRAFSDFKGVKMELVNIYIINTIRCIRGGWGYVGYILEAFRCGIPVTVQGFFKIKETPNRAELMTIIEAMGRLTKQCDIHIYTNNKQIYNALALGWIQEWEKNGWINSKGEKVKNDDLWKLLLFLANSDVTAVYGKHEYYEWMERYIRENIDSIEVIENEQKK